MLPSLFSRGDDRLRKPPLVAISVYQSMARTRFRIDRPIFRHSSRLSSFFFL